MRIPTLVLALLAWTANAYAQAWPSQPLKWVVPYPPGGNTDVIARAIAEKIAGPLGQPIVIENRAGASTITGTTAIARADDGHTIGLIVDSHSINASFDRPLPYDSANDFAPIIQLVRVPFALAVNAEKLPVTNLREFVAHAKAKPGTVNFASIGPGSPHQIAMEWFRALAGIDVVIVPYRGVAPAMNDVVAGHVQSMVSGLNIVRPQMEAMKVRAIAVTSAERLKVVPDVPTFIEQGYPSFSYITWYGMVGPKSMPQAHVQRVNAEIDRALKLPDIAEKIEQAGAEPVGGSAETFRRMMIDDIAKFRDIIKISGSKPD